MAKNLESVGLEFFADSKDAVKHVSVIRAGTEAIEKSLNSIKNSNAINTMVSAVSLSTLKGIAE